jgi:ABC-type dipeptide/oligopeptide/nickel transport system permease subunit
MRGSLFERAGNFFCRWELGAREPLPSLLETVMHGIIYLVGLVVVLLAILSFFGLR